MAAARQTGEVLLDKTTAQGLVYQNNLIFYLVVSLVILFLLRVTTHKPVDELARYVSCGLALGTIPPIIDGLVFRQPTIRYRYFSEFSWLMTSHEQPLGETVASWLTVLFTAGLVYWLTRKLRPTAVAVLGTYLIAQLLGTGLNMLVIGLLPHPSEPRIMAHHVAMLSVGLLTLIGVRPRALAGSLFRVNHALPFACVTAIGARLSGDPWPLTIVKASVILLAGVLVVCANDWYDRKQDASGAVARPFESSDAQLIAFMQLVLVASVGWLLDEAFVGLVLFLAITLVYHHPATRIKRWFGVAYVCEAIAAFSCFLVGALRQTHPYLPRERPIMVASLVIPLGFLLCSPFKDYKDIRTDARANIATLYTVLVRRGAKPHSISLFVALVLAVCLLSATALVMWQGAAHDKIVVLAAVSVGAAGALTFGKPSRAVERTLWTISVQLLLVTLWLPTHPSNRVRQPRYLSSVSSR